jgi:hypothetical protein
MTGGGKKMVLHTTESPREWIDGAIKQFTAGNGTPHLSIGWRKGFRFPVVAQFLPFDQYAKTLEHPAGTPETNRANAVQIEICGRASESRSWDDNWYRALANVLLLTQHRVGFPISPAAAVPGADPLHGHGLGQGEGHRRPLPRREQQSHGPGPDQGREADPLHEGGPQELRPR